MAKISHKGMWIDINSLNKIDKRNYLLSMFFFFVGALAWGVHLSSVGGMGGEIVEESNSSIVFNTARIIYISFWIIALSFYIKFYRAQDEFIHRYHQYIFSWGAGGFLVLGSLISALSPYIGFNPTFYEFFIAFALGTIVGGLRFHKKYLS